jgi:hypothetical protein
LDRSKQVDKQPTRQRPDKQHIFRPEIDFPPDFDLLGRLHWARDTETPDSF